eukprot:TRINITY_DN2560_c0_g3_i1.p1 TRINITY_DN2560_c0_g3~~TRINITY_DN2560_c0_g3_i1.p1  ORF type:complete len:182 (-),score=68.88 TRINITY_DN2560_c0_g3_i1:78-623(-)
MKFQKKKSCKSCQILEESIKILKEKSTKLLEEHNLILAQNESRYKNILNEKEQEMLKLAEINNNLRAEKTNAEPDDLQNRIFLLEKENSDLQQEIQIFKSDRLRLESDKIDLINEAERARTQLEFSENEVDSLKKNPGFESNILSALKGNGLTTISPDDNLDDLEKQFFDDDERKEDILIN